ncbi:hypothetical protein CCR75_001609 [Bremia lactucae]|uniref:Uncharacterized protein n=1 Tax=Bremia lactucae TaxID=4779 RepID=A0A976FHS3_BRELC|nr:hypothetical protein CCR75_001609 [Bremia lactucae]
MTVRRIVAMFENMAGSTDPDDPAHMLESPGRDNVPKLVTYYDTLRIETPSINLLTKTVRFPRGQPVEGDFDEDQSDVLKQLDQDWLAKEQVDKESSQSVKELFEREALLDEKHLETNDVPATPASSSTRVLRDTSMFASKIPPPKSRKLRTALVRKRSSNSTTRIRTSCYSNSNLHQPLYVPPPTPISTRIRCPRTSFVAFTTRIEKSSSRLLDFEKNERWLGHVETMKSRVETLKRRNQLALAKEVASAPRKSRSLSECSGVSTASTASMSSMDIHDVSGQ